jgi:hypothetical protein
MPYRLFALPGVATAILAVELRVYPFELAVGDVGIDLRRRNIRMSEEKLHRAQIGAVVEEVGGK